ncbi:MAG: cobalamin-dependent protein [Chromatiales bacterium]|jgi:methanogenic corrinoid protein MtbC1
MRAAPSNPLFARLQELPAVPEGPATAYAQARGRLLDRVDRAFRERGDLTQLLGGNDLRLILDNHAHHAGFIASLLRLGDFRLLADTLPWVYRTYHSRGIAYDYFPAELQAWMDAIRAELPPAEAAPILAVYRWMLERHAEVVELCQGPASEQAPVDPAWGPVRQGLLQALLAGDYRACSSIFETHARTWRECEQLFMAVIYPVMVEIGLMWETGAVNVAQEHQATATVSSLLTASYYRRPLPSPSRGRAVVTAAPGELHTLGAWMVARALEMDGWELSFLGADTPVADLIEHLKAEPPALLAVSAAMPESLEALRELTRRVRASPELSGAGIIAGGRILLRFPDLGLALGADACPGDPAEAVEWARGLGELA